jgi:membrane protease subunit HflC
MKRNILTLIIGAVLIVIFGLLLFTFQVRQTEVAVVTTFGEPTREITEPREFPFFKWPWPFQKVYKLDKRIQNFEDKFTENYTADNNTLLTMVYVGWRISEPKTFFPKFPGGSVTAAERMLEGILSNAKGAVVGQHNLADFVNADPRQLQFDAIEAEMKNLVQAQLETNDCGIRIEFLGIKKIGLPETVTQTVFDRMTSERKVLADRLDAEGQAEAAKIRSAADRRANEMLASAEAEATRIIGRGEAAAAEVLPVFEQNPELANFLLSLKALEASSKEGLVLVLDQRTPPFDYLFTSTRTNAPKP